MLLARDVDDNLVQMPFVSSNWKSAADLFREALAELQRPLPHRLVADQDAASQQHLLDHPRAQRKPEVQPDGMANHFRWKAVASVTRMTGRFHPSQIARSGHPLVNLTVPPPLVGHKKTLPVAGQG
jgi:hypothetical protein